MLEKQRRRQLIDQKLPSNFAKNPRAPAQVSRLSLKKLKQLSQRQQQKIKHLLHKPQPKDLHLGKLHHILPLQTKDGTQTQKPSCYLQSHLKSPTEDYRDYWLREGQNHGGIDHIRRSKMASVNSQQLPSISLNQCTDRKAEGGHLLRLPLNLLKQVSPDELAKRMKQKVMEGWELERAY